MSLQYDTVERDVLNLEDENLNQSFYEQTEEFGNEKNENFEFYNRVVKWKGVWLKKISEWVIEKQTSFSKKADEHWKESSLMIFDWKENESFEKWIFLLKRKWGFRKVVFLVEKKMRLLKKEFFFPLYGEFLNRSQILVFSNVFFACILLETL